MLESRNSRTIRLRLWAKRSYASFCLCGPTPARPFRRSHPWSSSFPRRPRTGRSPPASSRGLTPPRGPLFSTISPRSGRSTSWSLPASRAPRIRCSSSRSCAARWSGASIPPETRRRSTGRSRVSSLRRLRTCCAPRRSALYTAKGLRCIVVPAARLLVLGQPGRRRGLPLQVLYHHAVAEVAAERPADSSSASPTACSASRPTPRRAGAPCAAVERLSARANLTYLRLDEPVAIEQPGAARAGARQRPRAARPGFERERLPHAPSGHRRDHERPAGARGPPFGRRPRALGERLSRRRNARTPPS